MPDLLLTNIEYVSLRLFVTGNIVLVLHCLLSKITTPTRAYYIAVIVIAQLSFWYDYLIFGLYFK
jgi:hypothetical protein